MNTRDTEITKIGIIVIQSLRKKDRKTGEELRNDLLQYKKYTQKDTFEELYNLTTITEFKDTLKAIGKSMSKGVIFSLHFETHGSEEGIHLASGECLKWKEFYKLIRPINIKMGHLLIIVMAMCKGAALISSLEPKKRAPYLAFIGAFRNLTQDEIVRGFYAFYTNYTNALDIKKGMEAITLEIDGKNPKKKTFWCYSSEYVFDEVLDPDLNPQKLKEMAKEESIKRLVEYGETNHTLESVELEMRALLEDTSKKYRDNYCFKDFFEK
ncbi:hypothetical protein IWQ47_003050 [Aquimarina sp. EL_43]|nr:hypothetical protein [Aquimarina sp. EL_43]